ncbi:tetratricopeptide repeat protein [Methanospirillum hungatei]|uniref:tetratricopeptide repeat protein n=1 Tax=Methanospirillum hungatei TaxID=2203 RepID=UPI0026EFADE2|nr:tetratricopeptide repeat protein [Methanospirillum hungatei]MCA1915197.1 tetratricopeptide repeat protein [Methanospirillum hungatei]
MGPEKEGITMATDAIVSKDWTVTKLNPNIECALRDAQNCKMAGDYQLALSLYNKIIEEDPSNARALHSKANVLDLMGNYADAIRCYESALLCDPHNAEAWYNKGMTLRKTGRHEEGLEDIRKGISLAMGDI